MNYTIAGRDSGFFNTGRLVAWGVFLILAGAAVPSLKNGALADLTRGEARPAVPGQNSKPISHLRNAGKVISTRTRMHGIIAELKIWTGKYGVPRAGQLTDVVGEATATDAWGRRIRYHPPTSSADGWLCSLGADRKDSSDDIYVLVTWKAVNEGL